MYVRGLHTVCTAQSIGVEALTSFATALRTKIGGVKYGGYDHFCGKVASGLSAFQSFSATRDMRSFSLWQDGGLIP